MASVLFFFQTTRPLDGATMPKVVWLRWRVEFKDHKTMRNVPWWSDHIANQATHLSDPSTQRPLGYGLDEKQSRALQIGLSWLTDRLTDWLTFTYSKYSLSMAFISILITQTRWQVNIIIQHTFITIKGSVLNTYTSFECHMRPLNNNAKRSCNMSKLLFLSRVTAIVAICSRQTGKPANSIFCKTLLIWMCM